MTTIPGFPTAANGPFVDGNGILLPWALRFLATFVPAVGDAVPAAQSSANAAAASAATAASAAAVAQTTANNAQTAVTAETSRAEAAEALLAPLASPTFTGTVTVGGTGGPTITTGTAAPTSTQPISSLYLRVGGALGATLYVSRGAGTWAAVSGV